MTFEQLLRGVAYTGTPPQGEATLVTQDSRKVQPGAVYVCIAGRTSDGHAFAQKALDAGAGLVITQRPLSLANEVTVPDTRAAYALLCANFFGNPAEKLTLVGVTGTNGKTSVTFIMKQVLEQLGFTCGLIGTVRSEIGTVEVPAKFTTPEAWDLHALLARMVEAGCTHVVMEASSQALEQGRLYGVPFKLAIFTNLMRDHLDYHGDMESYFAAKTILLQQAEIALVNADDEWCGKLVDTAGVPALHTFSAAGNPADFSARDVRLRPDSVRFALLAGSELQPVRFGMPGGYSVANALAAIGGAVLLGCSLQQVVNAIANVCGVPGRCEVLYSGAFTVICDFAHTDDAIENLLSTLKPFVQGRMLVLFGPAGERDDAKRPGMGAAAAKYGDKVFITADNPRTEDIQHIFSATLPPVVQSGKPYETHEDREQALHSALAQLGEGDMLVLCGKGHEDYQALAENTIYFSERDIVHRWLVQARHL